MAVIGPNADSVPMLQGNYNGTASHPVTILNGIEQVAGPGIQLTYDPGCPVALRKDGSNEPSQQDTDDAVAAARSTDVVIFAGGISSRFEGEETRRANVFEGFAGGDRTRIELPSVQTDLLKALAATHKRVIFVNCSGSAMAMPWEAKKLPAIIQAWYPGEQGGRAVAEVLFGDINFSGHLPITFYASTGDSIFAMSVPTLFNRSLLSVVLPGCIWTTANPGVLLWKCPPNACAIGIPIKNNTRWHPENINCSSPRLERHPGEIALHDQSPLRSISINAGTGAIGLTGLHGCEKFVKS
ncbi:MAG TPA: glycoside hydrolase family 3 C-terminal domain-containing protein [Verrucomicrobiae bacterium]|nr:glycoside hydrolase family 3 C-terminal domain-containing protein [Verrucomicrobiae bacterium]